MGGWQINDLFDWSAARTQVLMKNSAGVFVDVSGRLMDFSVTLTASYAVDTLSITFDNTSRYMGLNFMGNREIEIYATFNKVEQEKLITGRIEEPETSLSKSEGMTFTTTGKDWTSELQNRIAVEIYAIGTFTAATKPYVGEIIRDLAGKYASTIDATAVPDTTTQLIKTFVRTNIFEVFKFLADLIGYRFYVNQNRVLIFEPIPTPVLIADSFTGLTGDPSGWTEHAGTWGLVTNSYVQSNASGTNSTYRTSASEAMGDTLIDCDVQIASGTSAGFLLRLDTATGNAYYLALDVPQNLIILYRFTNWGATLEEIGIAIPDETLAYDIPYHARIYCRTLNSLPVFYVFIDNMQKTVLAYADDSAYVSSGKVGFATQDAVATFDELTAANAQLIIEEGFNCDNIKIKTQYSRQKNNIYVEGGYEKFPAQKVIMPSGSTDEILLDYNPSETRVYVATVGYLKGGIKGIDDADATVDFLVDYFARKLFYRTGNWPALLTAIDYNKNIPVIANAHDATYFDTGVRDFVQTDKSLTTQELADAQASALLAKLKVPPQYGSADVFGVCWLMVPDDFVLVKSESNEIATYQMFKAESIAISYSKSEGLIYSFSLGEADATLPLLLNSIENRLAKLERRDIAQNLVRYEPLADSFTMDDAMTGEENDVSAAFKLGTYAKLGHNRKLGNASGGWGAAF